MKDDNTPNRMIETLLAMGTTNKPSHRNPEKTLWHNSIEGWSQHHHNFLVPRIKQAETSASRATQAKVKVKERLPSLSKLSGSINDMADIKLNNRYQTELESEHFKSKMHGKKRVRIQDLLGDRKKTISMACVNMSVDFPQEKVVSRSLVTLIRERSYSGPRRLRYKQSFS